MKVRYVVTCYKGFCNIIKYLLDCNFKHSTIKMAKQVNIREALNEAFQALNNKDDRTHYFDIHDDSLITHGIPGNYTNNKEGMKKYYKDVWQAFPDSNFAFDHVIVEGNEAACMFTMTGTMKGEFMGIPPSNKQVVFNGIIIFRFNDSKIAERWEVIDLLSIIKQLSIRQQLSALRNGIFEYAEIKANNELKEKINGLFKKHLTE